MTPNVGQEMMRRKIEILICLLYILIMSNGGAKTPGTSARYEETFAFLAFSILLVGIASVITLATTDLWFRFVLYPLSLFAGFALLLIDIQGAYGYGWDAFWNCLPFGFHSALVGALWLILLNGSVTFVRSRFSKGTKHGIAQPTAPYSEPAARSPQG
jgi:hypothetical protein